MKVKKVAVITVMILILISLIHGAKNSKKEVIKYTNESGQQAE